MSEINSEGHGPAGQNPEDISDQQWWFNLNTKQVEQGLLSAAVYRVGPFASQEEAANALETLKLRSQAWQKEEEDDR